MRNAITLLHISDMQFGKFHRFAEGKDGFPNPHDTLTARLIADLKHLAEHNDVRPDLIICTGDLAEWGMAKEFSDAFAFLAKLCDHYSLPRSRCIVIPGNHDINRKLCSAYFDGCEGNGEKPVFPWFPKWKPFKTAFDKFYEGIPGASFSEDAPWSLFIDEDLRVVVAGLNSTMDEGHDAAVNAEDRADKGHHGLCTEPQLVWFKEHLSDPKFAGWLRIGAVHHNTNRGCRTDDENLRDADILNGTLGQHLHVLLHGHTHEAKSDMLPAKVHVYSTGSASLKTGGDKSPVPTDVPNQYQFIVIKRDGFTRYCRHYAPSKKPPRFVGDVLQSENGSDWIVKDDADLSDVGGFTSDDETDVQPTKKTLRHRRPLPPFRIPPPSTPSPTTSARTNSSGAPPSCKSSPTGPRPPIPRISSSSKPSAATARACSPGSGRPIPGTPSPCARRTSHGPGASGIRSTSAAPSWPTSASAPSPT
jgi:3',5'-cyclic AMP phosphodiesterase CpdA